ncbi:hypothetical protein B296_00007329 [Ensete ventricosum]|uniref:Plant heme peroxidase family profile domain-containing protein n=1 Tax=Ensete ventricosum TaxID=4639 RepID=A0A426YLV4_ENSVE|nr:hypothetical protein B296_00007329 [Ensete ventricosum]
MFRLFLPILPDPVVYSLRGVVRSASRQGCDASVLVDSTDYNIAEKEAPPNLTLRAFDVIDDIKAEVEKECSGVVSCADILALAARDGVALSGGEEYLLPTGRRDGKVSLMEDAHFPGPSFSVHAALAAFQTINLDLVDLTTLLADPHIDPGLLDTLRRKCPFEVVEIKNVSKDPKVFMNQAAVASSSPFTLDTSFYQGLLNYRAVLRLDQNLAFTDFTSSLAASYINDPKLFLTQFSKSMIKLGSVGVLTGLDGEIRSNCRSINDGI